MKTKKHYTCPACQSSTTNLSGSGVCNECEEFGFWMDPAGGLHHDNPDDPNDYEDPAAMYE